MHFPNRLLVASLFVLCAAAGALPLPAKDKAPGSDEDMAKMVALGEPGPNHQLLAQLVGSWDSKVSFWMAPGAPTVSIGTAVRKPIMGGRYFQTDSAVQMQMPGADGKMHPTDYKGMEIDGYDNAQGKFFASWLDNMGTGLLVSNGSYDAATKTFTYEAEEQMAPGIKTKARGVVKVLDHDHYIFDWFQDHDGKETKAMEISYTRRK